MPNDKSAADRLADLGGKRVVVGDGITVREQIRVQVSNLPYRVRELAELLSETHSWDYSRDVIAAMLEQLWPAFRSCPWAAAKGKRNDRCCGARESGAECHGPIWKEREDLEWYVGEAHALLTTVDNMVAASNAGLAASYALELGQLLNEAKIKDRWEKAALAGQRALDSLPHPKHPSTPEQRVAAYQHCVDRNRQKTGKAQKTNAYADAAKECGCSAKLVEMTARQARLSGRLDPEKY